LEKKKYALKLTPLAYNTDLLVSKCLVKKHVNSMLSLCLTLCLDSDMFSAWSN